MILASGKSHFDIPNRDAHTKIDYQILREILITYHTYI